MTCILTNILLCKNIMGKITYSIVICFKIRTFEHKYTSELSYFPLIFELYADCRDSPQHTVTVRANDVHVGACKVLIKNRDQILLEEINDENSSLHYLQDIMQTIKDTEVELHTVTTDSRILKGTRQLLKRLNQTVSKGIFIYA